MRQSLDHLRSRKKPVTKTVWIALDSDVADRYAAAERTYDALEMQLRAQPTNAEISMRFSDAQVALDEAADELKSNSVKFIARSMGPSAYEGLTSQHPPTKDQRDEAKKLGVTGQLMFNTDTFPKALLVECVSLVVDVDDEGVEELEPLTADWVKEAYDGEQWNEAELTALFQAAFDANSSRRVIDMGNVSRRTHIS